jgi:acyl-CoA oxidase
MIDQLLQLLLPAGSGVVAGVALNVCAALGLLVLLSCMVRCVLALLCCGSSSSSAGLSAPLPAATSKAYNTLRDAITHTVQGDSHEFRAQAAAYLLKHKAAFCVPPNEADWSLVKQRDAALQRARLYAASKLVSIQDVLRDPRKFIAAHEMLALADSAALYLFSVHFNLYGGSLLKLGTAQHKHLLERVDSMASPGVFALTEFNHGVLSGMFMHATATYDEQRSEFVINTPPGAEKNWISLAARQGEHAIVFANLIMKAAGDDAKDKDGNAVTTVDEGCHAFVVPLRDAKTRKAAPGVTIEDMGAKPCVNGNDNAMLRFRNVRVPRANLLNRFSNVDAKTHRFSSTIEKRRDRFLRVSDQLMSGRIVIGSCAINLCQITLLAAVRFAIARKQALRGGGSTCLYEHMTHRRVLLPLLAKTYAMRIAFTAVKQKYHDMVVHEQDRDNAIHLVCAFKAYASLFATRCSALCREKLGGQGLLHTNKVSDLNAVAASLIVVEGDSMVLAQKVAGELLKRFVGGKGGAVRTVAALAGGAVKKAALNASMRLCVSGHLSLGLMQRALKLRQLSLTCELMAALFKQGVRYGKRSVPQLWSQKLLHRVVALNHAFVERTTLDLFVVELKRAKCAKSSSYHALLAALCRLFALRCIERDMSFFALHTWLPAAALRNVALDIDALCHALQAPHAELLVAAFAFPTAVMGIPAADGSWLNQISTKPKTT